MRQDRHECDTSATRVLQERHECDMSEKTFDFDNHTNKNIFHKLKITRRENFILRNAFTNASFPSQNEFEKCTTKTGIFNGKNYIKKLYTNCSCKFPCAFPHSYA